MKSSFVGLVSTVFGVGLGTLALLSLSTSSAHADTVYNYSDLSSFLAATTSTTLHDFEGIAPANGSVDNPEELTTPAPGRVTFGVYGQFSPPVAAVDSGHDSYFQVNGTDFVLSGLNFPSALSATRISLNDSYTAFSVEIAQGGLATPNSYTIALFNGNTQVGTDFTTATVGGNGQSYFYGATSDTAFNNVRVFTLQGSYNYTLFDNVRVGSSVVSSAVPEAGTLALALPALGIVGAVLVRRKK